MGLRGLLAVLFIAQVSCDLPVHCLHSQVAGAWTFYMDEGGQDQTVSCGHSMPDRDDDHKDHSVRLSTKNPRSYRVKLQEPAVAIDDNGKRGHWTMIYDEGFEVAIDDLVFFAFSHYHSNPEPSISENVNDCDRTFVGWYHGSNDTSWGCYYGIKEGAAELGDKPLIPRQRGLDVDNTWSKAVDFGRSMAQSTNFTVESFLELVNTAQSSFTVKYHDHMRNMSYSDLQRLAGSFLATEVRARPMANRVGDGSFNTTEMPTEWDWRNVNGVNYDSPFKYQGFCGSCYSMSVMQMLETRIRVATKNEMRPVLSSQDALSCSRYNQGCDGGYPFLVSKYAKEFGIVTEECFPYAPGSTCEQKCKSDKRIRVGDYYYVGGYYGGCNEAEMMQELIKNGPMVVSFNAGSDFMFYSGGVYSSTNLGDSFIEISGEDQPKVRGWEKTTHSVLLVGYGVDPAEGKYWIAKNTWGESWGERGYFRIKRGTDESAFESMALAATAYVTHITAEDTANQPIAPAHSQHSVSPWDSESNMIQEAEGENDRNMAETQASAAGNPQIKALEQELDLLQDPTFAKSYPSLSQTRTNDLGVSLNLPYDATSEAEKEEKVVLKPMQAQEGAHKHHHHKHKHYHHREPKTITPKSHVMSQRTLIENLQLNEGVNEFADPADK